MFNFAEEMMERFKGLDRAYGLYNLNKSITKKDGTKIVGKPETVNGFVEPVLWEKHLRGSIGLGIIPIMDDSCCYFGAIDIDIYTGLDYAKIASEIRRLDLPLVPCTTKSGGVHCFCFVKEKVPASMMREKLSVFAAVLGYGGSEIFPKQSEILSERGDIGQWINMPYFNSKDTNRYGIKTNGSSMTIKEFLAEIDSVRMTYREFAAFTIALAKEIDDGPPCLQHLLTQKFQTGSRNDGMFNLAIYLKRSEPVSWEGMVDDYNQRFVTPPLPSSDIQSIIKSVRKKDYSYTCNKSPIKNFCEPALCRSRKYGIGNADTINLTGLTKYDSRPPIWFVDVEGSGRMELSTEDLQSQTRFQRRCMESLNVMPPVLPANAWRNIISTLMENVTLIEASVDSSPRGLLFEYLERFCTSRVQGRNKEDILLGKPWSDATHHWFRLSDFYSFLERSRFKEFKINQIGSLLKENGGEHEFIKIKGKGVNVWKFPIFSRQTEKFSEPIIEDREVM